MPVIQTYRSQHLRDLVEVHTFPVDIADEKQFRTRVVNDVNGIIGTEILQNRHDDSTVSNSSQIDCHPVTVVATHHRNLVVFLDTALLEQDMQLLNINGQLAVSQGDVRTVVGNSRQVPILAERALEHLHKIVLLFVHHKLLSLF